MTSLISSSVQRFVELLVYVIEMSALLAKLLIAADPCFEVQRFCFQVSSLLFLKYAILINSLTRSYDYVPNCMHVGTNTHY